MPLGVIRYSALRALAHEIFVWLAVRYRTIRDWVYAKDYRTWLAHALFAAALAFLFNMAVPIVLYALNELNDIKDRVGNPVDYLMDFLSPVGAAVMVEYWVWPAFAHAVWG